MAYGSTAMLPALERAGEGASSDPVNHWLATVSLAVCAEAFRDRPAAKRTRSAHEARLPCRRFACDRSTYGAIVWVAANAATKMGPSSGSSTFAIAWIAVN